MVESIHERVKIYKSLFEDSPISLLVMDWSAIRKYLIKLKNSGVTDYRAYFENHPKTVSECLSLIKIINVNQATLELYKAKDEKKFLNNLNKILTEESNKAFKGALIDIAEGRTTFKGENPNLTMDGDEIYTEIKISISPEYEKSLKRVLMSVIDITERKQAEEKLKESEEKWRSITKYTPDHILLMDRDAKILFINHTVPDLTIDEVIGKSYYNFVQKAYEEDQRKHLNEVLETGNPCRFETGYLDKDGNQLYFEVYSGPLWKEGKVIGISNRSTDITERKKAEQKLIESEEKFRTAVENSPDFIVFIKADGTIFDVNRLEKGFTREIIIDQSVFNRGFYESEDQLESAQKAISDSIENKEITRFEYSQIAPDGSVSAYETRVCPFGYDNEGKIISLQLATRDITERKITEEKLKLSEEKLRMFMESATDGFILFDPELNYIDANNFALQIIGISKEDLIGKNIIDIAPNLKKTGRYAKYLDIIKTGKLFSTDDAIFNRLDGSMKYLSVRAFKVGENLGMIFTDIAERKRLEQKLKDSEQKLIERVKELSCLSEISQLHEKPDISIDEFIKGALDLIPPAIQFPEIICARIIFENKDYKTENYRETDWKLKTKVRINEKLIKLEVLYLEDKPFLKEENDLINEIAKRLKFLIERKENEDEIIDLAKFPSENPNPVLRVDKESILYSNQAGIELFQIKIGDRIPIILRDVIYKAFMKNKTINAQVQLNSETFSLVITPIKGTSYSNIYVMNITDLKNAEQELKQAHSDLNQIFNASLPMHVVDEDFNLIRVNDTFCALLQKTKENVIGKKCYDILKGPNCNTPRCSLDRVFQGEEEIEYEVDIELDKGIKKCFIAKINPFRSASGKVVGAIKSLVDITERKNIEDDLKESEEKFRTITEQSLMGIAILQDDVFKYVNQQFADIFGYSVDEILNWPENEYHKITHPEDLGFTMEQGRKKQLGEYDVINRYNFRGVKKTGEIIWLEIISHTFSYENKPAELISILNITERKKTEKKLIESEEKYRNLFEQSPGAIFLIDFDGEIRDCNSVTETMFGYSKAEVIGEKYFNFNISSPSHVDFLNKSSEKFLKTYIPEELELQIFKKTGELAWITSHSMLVTINKEKLIQVMVQDITDRKKAEEMLQESEEKYRAIFEKGPDSITLVESETSKIIEFNDKTHINLNYSREEFEELKISDFEVIESIKDVKKHIEKILNEGSDVFETKHITKDGEIKDIMVNSSTINIGGKILIHSIFRDITKLKRAEEELRLHSVIMTNLSEGVHLIRMDDGIIVYTNPRFEEIFGYDPGELIGKHISIINAPTDKNPEETAKEIMEILEESGEWHGEINNIKKDGTPFWCYANVSAFDHPVYGKVTVAIHTDITERKKAEEEIKKFQLLVENSSDFISMADMDHNMLFLNKAGCEIVGLDPKVDVQTLTFDDLLTKEGIDRSENIEVPAILESGHWSGEGTLPYLPTDESIPVHINSFLIKDQQGNPIAIGTVQRDIAEFKKAEEKIKESEEKFRNIATSVNDAIIQIDNDGKIIFWNESAKRIFGYDSNEVLQKEMHTLLIPKRYQKKYLRGFNKFKLTGEGPVIGKTLELSAIRKNNVEFPAEISISAVKLQDKWNAITSIRDITNRKLAEEVIKKSEETLKTFINSATDGFLLLDSKLNIIEANKIAIDILGLNNEVFIGKEILGIAQILSDRRRYEELMSVKKSGIPNFIEDRFNHSKQGPIDVAISAFKVGDGLGMIFTNITKHKLIEQELKEISELKTELLTRTSHELKTPLVSIKGNADLLLKEYSERFDFETITIMEAIKNGCLRLEDLINDLLKSSKLESKQIELKASYEDLVFLIKFTVNELKDLVDARNHKLILELHDKLNTKFEKENIFEVISNLLSNAIKNTPLGGEIKIQTEIKDKYIITSVKDSGIGFTKEEKQRIFKQFGKIERYGKGLDLGIEGSGLGLYISKKIIELHGGKIWMESEGRDKGSNFLFSLPIIKKNE